MRGALPDVWQYADTRAFVDRLDQGMPPAIISLTANGALRGPESSPHIPETADEIAESVGLAYDAGASIVHLHARDPACLWRGATDPEHWYRVHQAVRSRCPDIVIMDSTEGDPGMSYEGRTACLEARPEVASLTLGPETQRISLPEREGVHARPPLEWEKEVHVTAESVLALAGRMAELGIKPELEVKSPGHLATVYELIATGTLDPPFMVQTVLGTSGGSAPSVPNVLDLVEGLPESSLWLLVGKGRSQLPLTTLALLMGGHVRVGLEDNLYLRVETLGTNHQFVKRTRGIVESLGRTVATPSQTRRMLGLSSEPTAYP